MQYNHLYHDIEINYIIVEGWPNEFIPLEIADNITCLQNSDYHEREGYAVSLKSGNYEMNCKLHKMEPFPLIKMIHC